MMQKVKMKKHIINTEDAPKPVGPYSQAVQAGNLIFISGQIPLDPVSVNLVDGIENQIRQAFENIKNILEAENLTFSNIIKLTILLDNLNNFELVNKIMAELFTEPYPARAAYEVSKLPKNSSIEIETIAIKN